MRRDHGKADAWVQVFGTTKDQPTEAHRPLVSFLVRVTRMVLAEWIENVSSNRTAETFVRRVFDRVWSNDPANLLQPYPTWYQCFISFP